VSARSSFFGKGIILTKSFQPKAEFLQDAIFFLIHLFAMDVLVMKKMKIENTKPTFITSVLKVEN
jgi:hypothetical protein